MVAPVGSLSFAHASPLRMRQRGCRLLQGGLCPARQQVPLPPPPAAQRPARTWQRLSGALDAMCNKKEQQN